MDSVDHKSEKGAASDLPQPQLLEEVLKPVPHNPFLLKQILGIYSTGNTDPTSCDGVPQSPEMTGEKVHDNCSLPLTSIYPAVKDSVAQAVSGPDASQLNFGTSFLVCDDKCYYVTNDHVAGDASTVGIVSKDGKYVDYGKIVARDRDLDIVLVEPPTGVGDRTPVKIGSLPKVGDSVFTVGHPLASPADVLTDGKVSALGTAMDVKDPQSGKVQHYTDLISSGVRAFPGNSGGAEFNKTGEVIGVKVVATRGGSVSIPIQKVMDMVHRAEGK